MSILPFYDFDGLLSKLIKAWVKRDKIVINLGKAILILVVITALLAVLIKTNTLNGKLWESIAIVLVVIIGLLILSIASYQHVVEENELKGKIEKVEQQFKSHPEKPSAAWDLARIKLESYLNRNISQVRWIFFWTIIVMLAGFGIISYGIIKVYESAANFQPSILVTCVGVLTELIGATFLVIYKSTMNQAKDYVNVLERINAVGMSMQVLESISEEGKNIQNEIKAELAKELLKLYGQKR